MCEQGRQKARSVGCTAGGARKQQQTAAFMGQTHRQFVCQPLVVDAALRLCVRHRCAAADDTLGETAGHDLQRSSKVQYSVVCSCERGCASRVGIFEGQAGGRKTAAAACSSLQTVWVAGCPIRLTSACSVTSQMTEKARRSTSALQQAQRGTAGHTRAQHETRTRSWWAAECSSWLWLESRAVQQCTCSLMRACVHVLTVGSRCPL